ncbi:MAG: MFS transporter [Deltaproteobacteria bacterium]|nr:MFS transporter [Deltaproteobacteria bacterium]
MAQERHGRRTVFALTWVSYASYYLCRKGFGVTKARIEHTLGISSGWLAAIDTVYLITYAAGQFGSGILGDRIGARRLLAIGMIGSALACLAFGSAQGAIVLMVAFAVNGLLQSTGWPGNTKVMADWYPPQERGTAMGVWSTCYQAGGLAATAVATALLGAFGWRWAFRGPAIWVALVGVVLWLFLRDRPPISATGRGAEDRGEDVDEERREAFYRVILSPTVWSFGAAYFCLKIIRYSLLFWLPYYLHTALGYSESHAGYLSVSFEVGGIAGTLLAGYLSDRIPGRRRSLVATGMMLALAAALLLYSVLASWGGVANFAGMALVGLLLFGPDSILAGAAAQDLGGKHAAGTATGFVNGMGSVGAILQGAFTVSVREAFGWTAVFYAFLGLSVLGAVALAPTWRQKAPSPAVEILPR